MVVVLLKYRFWEFPLEVALILRDQQTFMILGPNQFLGYVPLYGGAGAAPHIRSARTIILWSGEVPSS